MRLASCLLVVLFIFSTALAQEEHHHDHTIWEEDTVRIACPQNIRALAEQTIHELVERDRPQATRVEIKGMIDIRCEKTIKSGMKLNMAEVVVVVDLDSGIFSHALFHMHFESTGKLIPTGGTSHSHWVDTRDKNAWKEDWCNYLGNSVDSLRKELRNFGCK